MRARTLALLALALAGFLFLGPTSAFELATVDRAASATLVSDATAYNAIVVNACNVLGGTGGTCNAITIANKATTSQYYNVSEDPVSSVVTRYRIDGSAWQTSGRIMTPNPVNVGGTSTVTLDVAACAFCSPRTVYYTVEGEKANSLNSMQTKIRVTVNYV